MNQVYINWRAVVFSILSFVTLLMLSIASIAQGHNSDRCIDNCFKTALIEKGVLEDGCINYQLLVSFEGKCSPALSHYSLDLGCGIISAASNSEGWPMELNSVDPTTGLGSLKVDEIQGFGDESSLKSFEVSFTFCPTDCSDEITCFSPAIAYKAGTCVFRDTLAVSCIKPLSVHATTTDLLCATDTDGSISLSMNGGVKPYAISWSGGETDSIIYELSPGLYTYEVISSDSQVVVGEIAINAPGPISAIENLSLVTCATASDGQISVNVSGGISPYTYAWSNGDSTSTISELPVGNYSVIVTDANGCTLSKSYSLGTSSSLSFNSAVTQPSCAGVGGAISLTVSGGQTPYTYLWSTGAETADLSDLNGGSYSVSVVDANGCSVEETFNLQATSNLRLSAYAGYSNCNDDPVGTVSLTVYGGASPYTYSWSNGSTEEDLVNVSSGTYEVTVTDANGCQATTASTVRIRAPYVYGNTTPVSCGQLGSITTTVYYAEQPIGYNWNTGDTTSTISELSSGNYELTVIDANGCTAVRTFFIAENNNISVNITENANACDSSQAAVLNAVITNGTAPYSYLWNTGDTIATIEPSAEGIYSVAITDANGCSDETNFDFTVTTPEALSCNIIQGADSVLCGSPNNYLFTNLNETSYSYSWTVTSSDGSWEITSANNTNEIYYTAGSDSVGAIFNLEIINSAGCNTSCSYQISACTTNNDDSDGTDEEDTEEEDDENAGDDEESGEDNGDGEEGGDDNEGDGEEGGEDGDNEGDGNNDDEESDEDDEDNGEDNGDGEDGGEGDDESDEADDDSDNGSGEDDSDNENGPDKTCTDCFDTNNITASESNGVFTYKFEVSVTGECRFDLSHYTLSLPACVELIAYNNSEGWKMEEIANDPTTGLSGIKVDDIDAFKEFGDTFEMEISFTLSNENCDISCWSPMVAYKAAQCVIYEEVLDICISQTTSNSEFSFYPNPATDYITIKTDNLISGEHYTVALYNDKGSRVATLAEGIKETINKPLRLPVAAIGETTTYYLVITGRNDFREVKRLVIKR